MVELTKEQQKALALARARVKVSQSAPEAQDTRYSPMVPPPGSNEGELPSQPRDKMLDTTASMVGGSFERTGAAMEPWSGVLPAARNVGRGVLGGFDAILAGGAGFAADMMPGQNRNEEKRLANDLYAMPEAFAGVSPLRGGGPIIAPSKVEQRSAKVIESLLKKSGKAPDDITAVLTAAHANNVPFNLAEALGKNAVGALASVGKSPGSARDQVIDYLTARQSNQGARVLPWIDDALGTGGKTARKIQGELEGVRKAEAQVNYPAADAAAGTVNMEGVWAKADELLNRNPITGDAALSNTELGKRVAGLTKKLGDEAQSATDYPTILRIKQDLGRAMKKDPLVASDMKPLYDELDRALEGASDGYRVANDTYRAQSRVLDALDQGRASTSASRRAADTVEEFDKMTPDQQAAFRAGYADPLAAKIEKMPITADRTGPLLRDKEMTELGRLSNDPEALMEAIKRERTMSETFKRVAGGSPTAENLADMGGLDVSAIASALKGDIPGMTTRAVRKIADLTTGKTDAVKLEIAKALIGQSLTGPLSARRNIIQKIVTALAKKGKVAQDVRDIAVMDAATRGEQ